MPRILRSPGSKSFRLENVSVPNADGARCERVDIRGGLRQGPLRVTSGSRGEGSPASGLPPTADVTMGASLFGFGP